MAKNNYWKSLKGYNGVGIIANTASYTNSATYADFIDEAAEGEVGVFLLGSDGVEALATDKTDALAAGDIFFVAQKIGNTVKKTQQIKYSEAVVRQDDYVAPVPHVINIGYSVSGTTGSLNNDALVKDDEFSIIIKDLQFAAEQYPQWFYSTIKKASASDIEYDMLHRLAKQINDANDPQNTGKLRIANANISTNQAETDFGSGVTPSIANGSLTVTFGSAHGLSVGDYVKLDFDLYRIAVVPSSTTITLDRPYVGATISSVAVSTAGYGSIASANITSDDEFGLELTAIDGAILAVSLQEKLEDADVTVTTAFVEGRGTSEQILELEKEFNTYDGHTAQNAVRPQNYGSLPAFGVAGETYDLISIRTTVNYESTGNPNTVANQKGMVVIATPAGAGPTSSLKTVIA